MNGCELKSAISGKTGVLLNSCQDGDKSVSLHALMRLSRCHCVEVCGSSGMTIDIICNAFGLTCISWVNGVTSEGGDDNSNNNNKGKAVPLQAWSGPEGSRKIRFPDFMTTAQNGGKVVSLTHRPPLPPGNTPGTHFC